MSNRIPKVGQVVYVCKVDQITRDLVSSGKPVTVSKVGNKYFYVDGFYQNKFYIDTLRNVSDYTPEYCIFFDQQEIDDIIEYRRKLDEVRTYIGSYGSSKLSMEKLRIIWDVIFPKMD